MDKLILYILLIPMVLLGGYAAFEFILSSIGQIIDIFTGTHDMFMLEFS